LTALLSRLAPAADSRQHLLLRGVWRNGSSASIEADEMERVFTDVDAHHSNGLLIEPDVLHAPSVVHDTWPLWLGEGAADTSALKALLAPFPSDGMISWPVRARVGNIKNNNASLIEPIKAALPSEASVLNARVFANERRESV
jgi:hypothetical protein